MTKRSTPLDLSSCGDAWKGWHIGPYGRARDWRLHSPDGQNFIPEEIIRIVGTQLDLDHWQSRARQTEAALVEARRSFDPAEVQLLTAAAMILSRRVHGTTELKLPARPSAFIQRAAEQLHTLQELEHAPSQGASASEPKTRERRDWEPLIRECQARMKKGESLRTAAWHVARDHRAEGVNLATLEHKLSTKRRSMRTSTKRRKRASATA